MKKHFVILMIILVNHTISNAEDYKQVIYQAYVSNDIMKWEPIMNHLEKTVVSIEDKLELLSYYYGFTAFVIGKNDTQLAKTYIRKGEKLIDEVLGKDTDNATATAFKGSFMTFSIVLNKMKAITSGIESVKYINKAVELDPDNIQAIADKGNLLFYIPRTLGGNKEEALKYFEKAINRLEAKNDTQNWFYLLLLTTQAQCYDKAGHAEKAYTTYQKILKIAPQYEWVKDRLFPDFQKRNNY